MNLRRTFVHLTLVGLGSIWKTERVLRLSLNKGPTTEPDPASPSYRFTTGQRLEHFAFQWIMYNRLLFHCPQL